MKCCVPWRAEQIITFGVDAQVGAGSNEVRMGSHHHLRATWPGRRGAASPPVRS